MIGPTKRWSMDFVHDTLADGRPFRILTVVENWSRCSPVLEARFRMTGETVSQVFERVLGEGQGPRSITVDHGTEVQSQALEEWGQHQSELHRQNQPLQMQRRSNIPRRKIYCPIAKGGNGTPA